MGPIFAHRRIRDLFMTGERHSETYGRHDRGADRLQTLPARQLVAVTICIHYTDYLACVIENKRHFDQWIVVTVSGDLATHALCEMHGIECHDSALLQADGNDFNAVNRKGMVINEGIQRLSDGPQGGDVWCVVLDADVYLPRHFGERVRAMPLTSGSLYGAYGRKVCETREQFDRVKECEPWERLAARNSQALGYFNLFSLAAAPNRYVNRTSEPEWEHDDYLFTTSFSVESRRTLPFTVLHLGKFGVNWHGRLSERYVTRKAGEGICASKERSAMARKGAGGIGTGRSSLLATSPPPGCGAGTMVMLGFFPGEPLREIAEKFSKIILVDEFRLQACGFDPIVEADRAFLRGLAAEQLKVAQTVELLRAHTTEAVAAIPAKSVDGLFIAGEASAESLCSALPHWLPKLRDGALIFGEAYGLPHFPDATYALTLLVGTPDEISPGGGWRKRYQRGQRLAGPIGAQTSATRDGIIIMSGDAEPTEALLMTLYAARKHWHGLVELWHPGAEDVSLRLVCERLQFALISIPAEDYGFRSTDNTRGEWWKELRTASVDAESCTGFAKLVRDVCIHSPFERALLLRVGDILIASPRFERAGEVQGEGEMGPLLVTRNADVLAVSSAAFAAGCDYDGELGGALLACGTEPGKLSEAAWEKWCEIEYEATVAVVTEIRVALGATVVTVVTPAEAGEFLRNWLTWRFRETPVVIVLVDIAPGNYWLPGPEAAQIIAVNAGEAVDVRGLVDRVTAACETERVIWVSPLAAALPGAELWPDLDGGWSAVHFPELARREAAITGNRFVPRNGFALLSRKEMEGFAERWAKSKVPDFSRAVIGWAIEKDARDGRVLFADLEEMGWQFPRSSFLESEPDRQMETDQQPRIRRREDGHWQLADDVVVISLPERTDRRSRIEEMMEEENVWFRFVDGVRVTDKEVQPAEVAEVGLEKFKTRADFKKYLQGMVGCRRAHLRELEAAHAAELHSMLIFEDDVVLVPGWRATLEKALCELPEGWMQLQFSAGEFRPSRRISPTLRCLGGAYQTTAVLYSKSGIAAALKCLRHSRSEIDHWLGNHLHPFGNSYVVEPQVACQSGGMSDILGFERGITP